MKSLIILFLTFAFSCIKETQTAFTSAESEYDLKFLFEVDGCKVYRFYDAHRYCYFTNCKGSLQWNEQDGKYTRPAEIPTN